MVARRGEAGVGGRWGRVGVRGWGGCGVREAGVRVRAWVGGGAGAGVRVPGCVDGRGTTG